MRFVYRGEVKTAEELKGILWVQGGPKYEKEMSLEDLLDEKKDLEDRIEELEEELSDLQGEMSDMEDEIQSLQETIEELEQ